MMRPIVSYEDIAPSSSSSQPPAKKRKTNRRHRSELTHEEIWDDSALIDAWAAANEEYAALHGEGKSWKDEDGPPSSTSGLPPDKTASEPPFEFEHEATPQLPNVAFDAPSDPAVSPDEAFQKAASAMYWAGYWTAVYHHKKRLQEQEEEEGSEQEVEENLVSTQR